MTAYTPRAKNLALLLLAMTQFVVVIDASIVNVALPSIGQALHFARTDLSWVVNAYALAFGGFLLLGGRMADLLGRRRMFMVGLVVFSLASLAGGLAQSEGWLIATRAVQGLGAAIVSPAALSIITTTFAEGAERNRALGIWGAVAGAGGAAGVLLGGILTSGLNWRWVLFVNVPIGLAAAALAPRTLVESRADDDTNTFDLPGAVTVTAGLSLLVYAIVNAVNVGWGSSETLLLIAGAVVLLIAFVMIESRQRQPLMPFSIFRLRTLRGADIVGLLLGMSLFSMFFFISLYLQNVLHYSPIKTGISYLPLAVGIIISAGLASQLVTRIGFRPTLIAGLLLVAGGLLWFSQVPGSGGSFAADVLGPSLLAALGFGFAFVSVTIAAVTGTRPHEAGLASGLINTSQQIGGALGLAILATIANSRTQSLFHSGVHSASVALTKGFDRAFLRRCRLRRRRCDPGLRADLLARQPRALDGRPQRRPGSRSRRRLTHPHGSASARLSGLPRVLAEPPRNSASASSPRRNNERNSHTPSHACASGRGPNQRRDLNMATGTKHSRSTEFGTPAAALATARVPLAPALSPLEREAWGGMLLIRALLLEQLDGELQLEQRLPLTHHDVLLKLSEAPRGQQRMSELADRALLTKGGLARVVDVLEKDGLVERVRSQEDGRGRYARLTPAGRARFQAAHPVHVRECARSSSTS